MGHGNHWQAVLSNIDAEIGAILDGAMKGAAVAGTRRLPNWQGPMGRTRADVTLLEERSHAVGMVATVVKAGEKQPYLHNAVPVPRFGSEHRVRILAVDETCYGLEARIHAAIGDANITFFDPYYVLHAERCVPGAEIAVTLAAIAYGVEAADPDETITHPEIGEISLNGMAMLLKAADASSSDLAVDGYGLSHITLGSPVSGPDDYRFRGTVQYMETATLLGRPGWRILAMLLRIGDEPQDVDIDVYVTDDRICAGDRPALGSDIAGTLWLQGFIAPNAPATRAHEESL